VTGMVEKVARTMYESNALRATQLADPISIEMPDWPHAYNALKEHWRGHARVAIETMREPTVEMLDAGLSGFWAYDKLEGSPFPPTSQRRVAMRRAHMSMIDEALK